MFSNCHAIFFCASCTGLGTRHRNVKREKLKGKVLIGALEVVNPVLVGAVIILTRKLKRNITHNKVVDAILRGNEENAGESEESSNTCGKEDTLD